VTTPLLEFEAASKYFPGVVALEGVSMAVAPGEIRALMGENGAGKSTLLKILSGEHRPDAGVMRIGGAVRTFSGPRDASLSGVAVIHQELQLAPEMSVEENLLLGAMPTKGPFIDRAAMRAKAKAVLARLGEDIDPRAKVKDLPIGRRQMVEIGKALLREASVIAFDEPTSSLSARETETLMRIIRDLKAEGRAILYVSHRMEEVFALCDSVTILRDGRHVATHADLKQVSNDLLISQMAGRAIEDIYNYRARPLGPVTLDVVDLFGPGLSAPARFSAHRGEILGFFGLIGAGRSELFKLIYGARQASAGSIRLGEKSRRFTSPREAIAAGVALCPEDRKDEGIVPLLSVRENLVIAHRNAGNPARVFRDDKRERKQADDGVAALKVKTASTENAISTLSGGNQQKVVLARWLAAGADIFLMDEPTRGIDVGARSEIYGLLYRLSEEGKTVLVASSDMAEIMGLCDRVIVMREGRIAGELDRSAVTQDALLRLALPDARPAILA
jgi:L-arabinose transport system ATP-binding protein